MRVIVSIIFIISCLTCAGQATRVVRVAPRAIFPFEPISGRYVGESLAPVATYVQAWREEGALELIVNDSLLSKGYKMYLKLEDSTLFNRVLTYLNASVTSTDTMGIYSTKIYDFPQSRDFMAHFASDIQRIKRYYSTPLRKLINNQQFNPYCPSEFSSTMHDFQLTTTGADLSIFAPPRIDAAFTSELYIGSVLNLFYFDNQLVVVKLSGFEVKKLLEQIYDARYYTLKNLQSDLLRTTLPASMHASLAGAWYTVNLTKPRGHKIEELKLDPKAVYRVAMNSFAASKLDKPAVEVGEYKYLLIKYLKDHKSIENREHWRLKPERWVEEIKARESLQINYK